MKIRKIILASSSPQRKKILKMAGINFLAVSSGIDENLLIKKFKHLGVRKLAKILSFAKAISVVATCHSMRLRENKIQGNEVIAGFDTIIILKKKILGKPKNKNDAVKILLSLSGKQHTVCTGIALIDLEGKNILLDCDVTRVFMKKISLCEARNYVNSGEALNKAGAYAIQETGKKFIKKIKGDYHNVVGLPLERFIKIVTNSTKIL